VKVDLGTGQSAELRPTLNYAAARDVRRASLAAETDRMALADFDMVLVRAYLVSATLGIDDSTDDAIVQKLAAAALSLWNGKLDPKAGGSS
jgi:hypothetical protein